MSYSLNAFFALEAPLRVAARRWKSAYVVSLPQGLAMLPLTQDLAADMGYQSEEMTLEAFWNLPDEGAQWAQKLSLSTPVGFIEIDMFGGTGPRSAVLWQNGEIALGPFHEPENDETFTPPDGGTNRVFAALGVQKGELWDEFDALDLGRHRHTAGWWATAQEQVARETENRAAQDE